MRTTIKIPANQRSGFDGNPLFESRGITDTTTFPVNQNFHIGSRTTSKIEIGSYKPIDRFPNTNRSVPNTSDQ